MRSSSAIDWGRSAVLSVTTRTFIVSRYHIESTGRQRRRGKYRQFLRLAARSTQDDVESDDPPASLSRIRSDVPGMRAVTLVRRRLYLAAGAILLNQGNDQRARSKVCAEGCSAARSQYLIKREEL